MAMLRRLGCEVSDLGILRDERDLAGERLAAGGRHARPDPHHRRRLDRRRGSRQGRRSRASGKLVLWRMAIKPGRPVAMGIIGGTPFIGLPGNPVASFVTFVHVVRPTILALSGARPEQLMPMPVRAAFTYKKKIARREYVRVILAQGRRRRARGDKVSARGRRPVVLAGRYRWPRRTRRGRHAGLARPDRRLPVLCEPDQLTSR